MFLNDSKDLIFLFYLFSKISFSETKSFDFSSSELEISYSYFTEFKKKLTPDDFLYNGVFFYLLIIGFGVKSPTISS